MRAEANESDAATCAPASCRPPSSSSSLLGTKRNRKETTPSWTNTSAHKRTQPVSDGLLEWNSDARLVDIKAKRALTRPLVECRQRIKGNPSSDWAAAAAALLSSICSPTQSATDWPPDERKLIDFYFSSSPNPPFPASQYRLKWSTKREREREKKQSRPL